MKEAPGGEGRTRWGGPGRDRDQGPLLWLLPGQLLQKAWLCPFSASAEKPL